MDTTDRQIQIANALELELTDHAGRRGKRGRKDQDGSQETIKLKPIQDGAGELMALYKRMQLAREAYNTAARVVAERGLCNTATLKKLIAASAAGNFEDVRRAVEQQQCLFEGVGEVKAAE